MAAEYALYDFEETLKALTVPDRALVESVVAAWGRNGDYSEWDGGFLMRLRDGRYAYATGWCDTTGWGCQDGCDVILYEKEPQLTDLKADAEWDREPADLNKWLHEGAKDSDDVPVQS